MSCDDNDLLKTSLSLVGWLSSHYQLDLLRFTESSSKEQWEFRRQNDSLNPLNSSSSVGMNTVHFLYHCIVGVLWDVSKTNYSETFPKKFSVIGLIRICLSKLKIKRKTSVEEKLVIYNCRIECATFHSLSLSILCSINYKYAHSEV